MKTRRRLRRERVKRNRWLRVMRLKRARRVIQQRIRDRGLADGLFPGRLFVGIDLATGPDWTATYTRR